MFGIGRSSRHSNTARVEFSKPLRRAENRLTLHFAALILWRWRSASMSLSLLYRPKPVRAGHSGAAIDLTAKALGWSRIHFAVRQLAAGGEWRGYAPREERCLV